MTRYAQHTEVSSEKSKAEIERLLTRYGATAFVSGWQGNQAAIKFEMNNRHIKFMLPLPDRAARDFTHNRTGAKRSQDSAHAAWEQATRQRWRALALVVKAKLEAVETGITTFEDEFMAHIVLPDGKTVAEHAKPMIEIAYASGKVQKLFPVWEPTTKGGPP